MSNLSFDFPDYVNHRVKFQNKLIGVTLKTFLALSSYLVDL